MPANWITEKSYSYSSRGSDGTNVEAQADPSCRAHYKEYRLPLPPSTGPFLSSIELSTFNKFRFEKSRKNNVEYLSMPQEHPSSQFSELILIYLDFFMTGKKCPMPGRWTAAER